MHAPTYHPQFMPSDFWPREDHGLVANCPMAQAHNRDGAGVSPDDKGSYARSREMHRRRPPRFEPHTLARVRQPLGTVQVEALGMVSEFRSW